MARAPLPDYDEIRRRYAVGAAFWVGTTGEYLLAWVGWHEQADDWAATTLHSYERVIRRLLLPGLR
jgi:hypothetical protein